MPTMKEYIGEMREAGKAPSFTDIGTATRPDSAADEDTFVMDTETAQSPEQAMQSGDDMYLSDVGRERFEATVLQNLGGNPFEMNVLEEVNKITKQNAPQFFRKIFGNSIAWEDRHRMDKKQYAYWQQAINAYRANALDITKAKQATMVNKYNFMMNKFDNRAQSIKAQHKATTEMLAKLQTDKQTLLGKRSTIFEKIDKANNPTDNFGRPIEAGAENEALIKSYQEQLANIDNQLKQIKATEEAYAKRGQQQGIGGAAQAGTAGKAPAAGPQVESGDQKAKVKWLSTATDAQVIEAQSTGKINQNDILAYAAVDKDKGLRLLDVMRTVKAAQMAKKNAGKAVETPASTSKPTQLEKIQSKSPDIKRSGRVGEQVATTVGKALTTPISSGFTPAPPKPGAFTPSNDIDPDAFIPPTVEEE